MSQVNLEFVDDVAVVTTVNPPAELFDHGQIAGLVAALGAASDNGCRAMVIKSDSAIFSGGADVSLFLDKDRQAARAFLSEAMDVIWAIEDAPFPVIAAVNGLCYAAGLEIALACDFIYAADDAVFSQVEALIGVTTFLGGAYRLAERCGPAIAREIVYTADSYTAEQFAQWHIVNRVVPTPHLHEAALSVATTIARGPVRAHAMTKRMVRHALSNDSRSADSLVLNEATALFETRDMKDAVGYLLEHGSRRFRSHHHEIEFHGR
ncbi:enoyl-CoA hydratase/isomerase family protein [Nocardioides sp. NPDC051685]|uniref:enoyl-CoA hydratase/isomerase family protein n=1 Tax=Nocardioides sp. NPDC051685 TaxID=3364334 RepID=UPI00379CC8EB